VTAFDEKRFECAGRDPVTPIEVARAQERGVQVALEE